MNGYAGTKAMAVHSHETWRNHTPKSNHHWAAYISSDGPTLWFDTVPTPFPLYPNTKYSIPEPTLNEILNIHQIVPANSCRPYRDFFTCDKYACLAEKIHHWIVTQPGNEIMRQYLDLLPPTYMEKLTTDIDGCQMKISGELSFLSDFNFRDNSYHVNASFQKWADAIKFINVANPTLDNMSEWLQDGPLPTKQAEKKQCRVNKFKWIATEWLETWVAKAIMASKLYEDVYEGFEFKVPNVPNLKAEVDVCAMRGHTPFVFSCTVDAKSGLGKHKLFEVRLRANQLGGEHARAAVVCLSETPEAIQKELNHGWSGYQTIKVFGLNDIRTAKSFNESLKEWIQSLET